MLDSKSQSANRSSPHRLVVRTSRRGRDNPGSTPGEDIFHMLLVHHLTLLCLHDFRFGPALNPRKREGRLSKGARIPMSQIKSSWCSGQHFALWLRQPRFNPWWRHCPVWQMLLHERNGAGLQDLHKSVSPSVARVADLRSVASTHS